MKVIHADHERRYDLPGALGAARRPVDVDVSNTDFTRLRSLRLYRFEAGYVVDGHAEEDEVYVVVTAGSVAIKIGWDESAMAAADAYTLSAPEEDGTHPFVAFLPPGSVYQLTPLTQSDVAYARSTPRAGRLPAIFSSNATASGAAISTVFENSEHAERLRLKVQHIDASGANIESILLDPKDADCEALIHVQGTPADHNSEISSGQGERLSLQSWDTVAIYSGEQPTLHVPKGAQISVLTVQAS